MKAMQTASAIGVRGSPTARGRLGIALAVAVLMLFSFFPIYWMLVTSLKPDDQVFQFPPTLIPGSITLEHYSAFFSRPELLRYLANSVIVASATAVGGVVVSAYAAYSFSKFRYRGRRSLMYLILSAQLFPQALLLISLYLMFDALGLLNTYAALVLAFTTFTLPLCVFMLKSYFDKIPTDILEAAKIDGASQGAIMRRVLVPLAGPGLVATGLFAFIRAWNDFIFALTLVGSRKRTLPPGLVLTYLGEFQANWGEMMAASLLVSLPVVLAFVALQRHLVEGLTAGAIKG